MAKLFTETVRSLFKVPELKDALIQSIDKNKKIQIKATWNLRNLCDNQRTILNAQYLADSLQNEVCSFTPTIQDKKVLLSSTDRSKTLSASLLQDEEICYLNVISENGETTTINLKDADLHGKVYADEDLSSFTWSPDSTSLGFVAEKKTDKAISFFAKPSNSSTEKLGEQFAYIDDWGEQMEHKHQSSVVVVNVTTKVISVLNLPEGICVGQIQWTPEGDSFVGVAYVTDPYRLGLIYCRNRESFLFHLDLQENFTELTGRGMSVHSPRFSPDGSSLVYLRFPMLGPHVQSAQLCLMSWENKEIEILIDYVPTTMNIMENRKFSGIYGANSLAQRCWSENSKHILFSSFNNSVKSTYMINTDSKEIYQIPLDGCVGVLDVTEDYILLSQSSLCSPHQIILMKIPCFGDEDKQSEVSFIPVSPKIKVDGIPDDWQDQWTLQNPNPHPQPEFTDIPVAVLYFGPTKRQSGEGQRPLIVWVHGGPHSVYPNTFTPDTSFFIKLGYSIVFPNYRGTLGQGKKGVESLPGFCGHVDADDVYQATLSCLKRYDSILDPSRVVLMGGSHGGFLVTHLAAQHPDLYKAVSSRNPVTYIPSLAITSDIPDWSFVEAGFSYEMGKKTDETVILKMHKMSPMSLIDNVKAPTLLLLGKLDKRVPLSQGLAYHKMLLARKVPTKAFIYDDWHALSKVDVSADCLIQTALWFNNYLEAPQN